MAADSNVTRPQSTYFIEGFEQLRDVIDLRDRLAQVKAIEAETRDGLEMIARDAQMLFRVFAEGDARSLDDPYPYSEESLRRLVYGRAVTSAGLPAPESVLKGILEQELKSFVARYSLEEFLSMEPGSEVQGQTAGETPSGAPALDQQFQIARRELTERFHTPELKARLKDRGLALAWVGVGAWEIGGHSAGGSDAYLTPEKTLLDTWRNYQRLRLYRSAAFLQRQRLNRFHDRLTEVPRAWLRVWRSGELPRTHRCYELLALLLRQIKALKSVEDETSSEHAENLHRLEGHLEQLLQPDVLGGQNT
jgi:hypothetical protein